MPDIGPGLQRPPTLSKRPADTACKQPHLHTAHSYPGGTAYIADHAALWATETHRTQQDTAQGAQYRRGHALLSLIVAPPARLHTSVNALHRHDHSSPLVGPSRTALLCTMSQGDKVQR